MPNLVVVGSPGGIFPVPRSHRLPDHPRVAECLTHVALPELSAISQPEMVRLITAADRLDRAARTQAASPAPVHFVLGNTTSSD